MSMCKPYENVFEAIEDNPVMAENMRLRAKLMFKLRNYIKQQGMTQEEAARRIGVNQPRISDLVRGKFEVPSSVTLLPSMTSNQPFLRELWLLERT